GLPLLICAALVIFQVTLHGSEELLAGLALAAGALLTGFAQVAGWRERLLSRDLSVNALRIRALNEAVTNLLVSLVASLLATLGVIVLSNLDLQEPPMWLHWLGVSVSGVVGALLAFVGLSLVIVVNLLWDAYTDEGHDARRSDRHTDIGTPPEE